MLASVDVDELQHALGGVVLEAAYLERALRTAFSALVGSKYAAVVAGHLTESALIENCRKITEYHTGLAEPTRQSVLAALTACDAARRKRNRVMHDAWSVRPGGDVVAPRADRGHDVTVTARATDEVERVAGQLAEAVDGLSAAMTAAFGRGWARVEDQLRQELGHDISADFGG